MNNAAFLCKNTPKNHKEKIIFYLAQDQTINIKINEINFIRRFWEIKVSSWCKES